MNIKRIIKEGLSGKNYVFYNLGKTEYVIPNKYGAEWWKKASKSDIRRVSVR